MLYASVDPRDNISGIAGVMGGSCSKCCCETIHMRPGETNLMVINYAPWAIPFARKGLACNPQFDIEQLQACPAPSGTNLPPVQSGPISYAVPFAPFGAPAPAFNDDLKDFVTDPEAGALTFELVPFYSVARGKLALTPDGTFTYTPPLGYNGQDRFFFTASDGVNDPVMFEAVFQIGSASTLPAVYTPAIGIGKPSVHNDDFTLSFSISTSPAAKPCETYRINVRQGALDCDCECYWHTSCYDIMIQKC